MDPLLKALSELPQLVADYKRVAADLAEAQKQLAALKDDQYVSWEWVCAYFGITKPTAVAMLQDEKIFAYGQKVKRLKKSMVLAFAERNSIKVKEVAHS
jgi:hypothetical protein